MSKAKEILKTNEGFDDVRGELWFTYDNNDESIVRTDVGQVQKEARLYDWSQLSSEKRKELRPRRKVIRDEGNKVMSDFASAIEVAVESIAIKYAKKIDALVGV
jgi:hypothetical protein